MLTPQLCTDKLHESSGHRSKPQNHVQMAVTVGDLVL